MRRIVGLVTALFVCLMLTGCQTSYNEGGYTEDGGLTQIADKYIYEFVDEETGVHYLVFSRKSSQSGAGGITPRLNADGSVMIDE